MQMKWQWRFLCAGVLLASYQSLSASEGPSAKKIDLLPDMVSYYKDVRPVIQQHCQGCHQPAKAQGGYVMTGFADLMKKTDNGVFGVVPGKPDESELVKQITAAKGQKPQMPR